MKETDMLPGRVQEDLAVYKSGTIFHIRAAALILQDQMLLVAKSADDDCCYLVGGGVRINESAQDAVMREVYEETGYRLEVDRLLFLQERFCKIGGQQYHEIVFFYLMKHCCLINIAESSTSDLPQETLHWLPIGDLSSTKLVPEFLRERSFDAAGIEHIVSRDW